MRLMYSASVAAIIAATSSGGTAFAQTQTIATPINKDALNLLMPFSTLTIGGVTLQSNFNNAININNNPGSVLTNTSFARAQALIDNTITTDNGVILADALGSKMAPIWNSVNAQTASGATTTFSPNVLALFRQINAISQDDSGKAKNFFADGSANGSVFNNNNLSQGKTATSNTPVVGVALPPGGNFNIYDLSYLPSAANKNLTGNSRPIQVAPGSIQNFSGVDAFGNPQSNTNIAFGANTNTSFGLKANASAPSGHTTFGYTTSILFAMLVPERYQQFMTRASEYGNSRIVLGVHYPLDVMMGRVLGTYDVVQMLNNNPKYLNATVNGVFGIGDLTTTNNFSTVFNSALTDVRGLLQAGCGTDIATCSATSATDRFSGYSADRSFYFNNLTYGLAPTTLSNIDKSLFPALGTGPEILLLTRFPYLTPAQRQDVLATTGLPAGGPLDNADPQFAVYARLNLFAASDGYGFFNSAVVVNQDSSLCAAGFTSCSFDTWRNDIGGTGSFTKTGNGTLVFTGNNTYTGGTIVNGGSLIVTGALASPVTVGTGGTFGGVGTIPSAVVNGTLAPGLPAAPGLAAAPGTLTIQGNLQLTNTANYLVRLAPGSTSRTNVGGTATIAGAASASFAPGIYSVNSKIPVLVTSAGGLSGTFSSLAFNSAGINVTPVLSYDGQDVFFTLKQASLPTLPAGTSSNASGVINALNTFVGGGGTLPTSFQSLFALPGSTYADTLNHLAGQTGTATAQSMNIAMTGFLGSLVDFSGAGRSDSSDPDAAFAYAASPRMVTKAPYIEPLRWSGWATVFGGAAHVPGDPADGSQDLAARIYGTAAGFDYRVAPDLVLGVGLSGGETNFGLSTGAGDGRADFIQGGVYGKYRFGDAYIAGAAAGGTHDVRTHRTVNIAGINERLEASFDAEAFGGRLEAGYRVGLGKVVITPYGAVQVQDAHTPAYSETTTFGQAAAAQGFASHDEVSTRTELGSWIEQRVGIGPANILVRGRLAWVHNFDRDISNTVAFAVLPGTSFVVNGAALPSDAALLSAVTEVPIGKNLTVAARFDGEFAGNSTSWSGNGSLRYRW
jgi:autotransporter-associated beta strand protein